MAEAMTPTELDRVLIEDLQVRGRSGEFLHRVAAAGSLVCDRACFSVRQRLA